MSFDLSEYVDVAERVRLFYERFPNGSLQSEITFTDTGVLCKAFAYRDPDDPCPTIGHAHEVIPGKTPYTKDSEVMNAETSAWGRAIVAAGFDTKKIASANEVRARQDGAEPDGLAPVDATASSAPNPAARAMAAQHANRSVPDDDGKPENVVITFGKNKGSKLGQVPRDYLEWLVQNFTARSAEQRRIVMAAGALLGGVPAQAFPDDDIPFSWIP